MDIFVAKKNVIKLIAKLFNVPIAELVKEKHLKFQADWTIEKWNNIEEAIPSAILRANPKKYGKPELIFIPGNIWVAGGEDRAVGLLAGEALTALNNANAYLGVGNGVTAATNVDTALAGASQLFKAMNATYPLGTGSSRDWQSDFAPAEANFAWDEWGIADGATPPSVGTLMNRKVEPLGTKTTGTWTLTATVTVS